MKLVQKILNSLGEIKGIRVTEQGSKTMMSDFSRDLGFNDAATPLYPNFPGVPPPWGCK